MRGVSAELKAMANPSVDGGTIDQDREISEAIERERLRLLKFIRRRVPDREEAEDILQEVFYELIAAYRLMKPVEQVSAWLFRVARNRIVDFFRARRPESLSAEAGSSQNEDGSGAGQRREDLLVSRYAEPDEALDQQLLSDALEEALAELTPEQRQAFVGNELEGRSFKDLSAETGVGVNTLLARKHYAVLRLRRRLQSIYDDLED